MGKRIRSSKNTRSKSTTRSVQAAPAIEHIRSAVVAPNGEATAEVSGPGSRGVRGASVEGDRERWAELIAEFILNVL